MKQQWNKGTKMSTIILLAQTMIMITNVKSTILHAQEPNASFIQVKSTKQKHLDDDVYTSPPKRNAIIHKCVGTLTRKQHDFIVIKKRKKRCDENLDIATKLAAYAT
jgi:hypothetical protein